jgi:hypothetical protein
VSGAKGALGTDFRFAWRTRARHDDAMKTMMKSALCHPALLLLALAFSAKAQTGPPDLQISPDERSAVIDGVIAKLNEIYVFPETAKRMEEALRARAAKQEYDSISSAKEFASKLKADLREVSHDKHLGVMFFREGAHEPSANGPSPDEMKAQLPFMQKLNFGFDKVERMQGNIGYLEIRGFAPPAMGGETAAAAMTFLANTDALIVDLRRNSGGEPAMIAYVLSYLFDEPTHLNDIYQRRGDKTQQWWTLPYVPGLRFGAKKPVFVLTSRQTFSGAEEFAYNLKQLKRATLIGETTGGGAHPSRPVKVSEHFMIELPYARAINPITGTNWEGAGVTPDIEKPAEQALDAAYWMAVEKIIETSDNPRQKGQLQKLLEEKKGKPE